VVVGVVGGGGGGGGVVGGGGVGGEGSNGGFLWAARLPCVELPAGGASASGGVRGGQQDLYVEFVVLESNYGGAGGARP